MSNKIKRSKEGYNPPPIGNIPRPTPPPPLPKKMNDEMIPLDVIMEIIGEVRRDMSDASYQVALLHLEKSLKQWIRENKEKNNEKATR